MAKKKTNYMQEKRFSINDLLIGCAGLAAVVFVALCLSSINIYSSRVDDTKIVSFAKGGKVSEYDIFSFYKDKINEIASEMVYGDSLSYTLVDINKDGIKDLILKSESNESGVEYLFYTYDEYNTSTDTIVYAGNVSSKNCKLYQMNDQDFLVAVGDYSYYVYLDNSVVSTFQVTTQERPLTGSELEFKDFQDLSLFR